MWFDELLVWQESQLAMDIRGTATVKAQDRNTNSKGTGSEY